MKRIRYLTLLMLLIGSTAAWAQDDEEFNPANPTEPGQIVAKSQLTVVANPSEGGRAYGGGKYVQGEGVGLSASAKSGFRFVNWTNAVGTVVSTMSSFTYTKGEGKETLTANFEFDPSSPTEPDDINQNVKHWLRIVKEEGGSASSSNRYKAGTSVTVTANANSLFDFVGWYDENGTQVSSNTSYTLTMPAEDVMLTARFNFNPDSPGEPGEIKAKHILTLAAEEGGSAYAGSYRLTEGENTTIRANTSTGFEFVGWYKNGVLYTESPEFDYVQGATNEQFVARFNFNPSSPTEPAKIEEKKYAFYLMNVINKPGATVQFPVYLTTREEATDMTFQLSFPNNMLPDMGSMTLSGACEGYSVSYADGESTEERTAYVFTLTAGETPIAIGNNAILTFNITIPDDTETAKGYPVTINQVSVTDTDDNTQHAGTRNGRISVYKKGDSNGDDVVDAADVTNTISEIMGKTPEVFITEVADTNEDEEISVFDVIGIIDIILNP